MVKVVSVVLVLSTAALAAPPQARRAPFQVDEATISGIQQALQQKQITTVGLVEHYLWRVQAYNGTCVNQPQGILGPITTIPHARQINALVTLNLRPATRATWGFDARKARSLTDPADDSAAMPDALETARAQDAQFARTGRLVGPLHGVVMAIKDQYDTFDMRTTAGGDVQYANDRPPDDATFVQRLRDAGAIILAKANLAEYAVDGARSSYGGTFCNPYDTEREPGMSSAGSASAVAANLVTCAIGEETVVSIRWPASVNSLVGVAPTVELVSHDGMIGAGINMRTGPICRTVTDAAKVLDVIAGYDPNDPVTVSSIARKPQQPYASAASARRLDGVRIGVIREYMNRDAYTKADEQSLDLAERAVEDLRKLGATIVDPGRGKALFQPCFGRWSSTLLRLRPPVSLLTLNTVAVVGEDRYQINRYLSERGDMTIGSNADLIEKGRFYNDPNFPNRRQAREAAERQAMYDPSQRLELRAGLQTLLLQCMQEQKVDAWFSPMSTVPPRKLTNPREPPAAGRTAIGWSVLGQQGFPAITVPAGFTSEVWDRERDGQNGTQLVGPVPAQLPVGVDLIAAPFNETLLIRIAAAYEAATRHRRPPPEFGPVPGARN
jgi:Asp-tRNA(Asn)/Glu-tRNA(Gln) amidotransferase A subunit family amidase